MLYVKEWFPEIIIPRKDPRKTSLEIKDTEFPALHRIHSGNAQTLIVCDLDPRKFPESEILLQKILGAIGLKYENCSIFIPDGTDFQLSDAHYWLAFLDSETASKLKNFNARPFWSHPKALVAPSLQELVSDAIAKKKLWSELQNRSWK